MARQLDQFPPDLSKEQVGQIGARAVSAMARGIASALLILACVTAPGTARAQDVSLKDAIQCKDFKHNSDGTWSYDYVSLNLGPPGKQHQLNLFGPGTIRQGKVLEGGVDLWAVLNEKCGAGK
jgi:hypothetical protein